MCIRDSCEAGEAKFNNVKEEQCFVHLFLVTRSVVSSDRRRCICRIVCDVILVLALSAATAAVTRTSVSPEILAVTQRRLARSHCQLGSTTLSVSVVVLVVVYSSSSCRRRCRKYRCFYIDFHTTREAANMNHALFQRRLYCSAVSC